MRHGADSLRLEQLVPLDPEHWFSQLLATQAVLAVPAS